MNARLHNYFDQPSIDFSVTCQSSVIRELAAKLGRERNIRLANLYLSVAAYDETWEEQHPGDVTIRFCMPEIDMGILCLYSESHMPQEFAKCLHTVLDQIKEESALQNDLESADS